MNSKWMLIALLLSTASSSLIWAYGDAPDLELEDHFHSIYEKYNSTPTPVENWNEALGKKKIYSYEIQKGDSLWAVSDVLFADPYFWPKVWAQNIQSIHNPHEVSPEMKVQFFEGSEVAAPIATLAKADPIKESEEAQVSEKGIGTAPLKVKKGRKITPLLRQIPPSLPSYRMQAPKSMSSEIIFKLGKTKQIQQRADLEYYIHEGSFSTEGTILEFPRGSETGSELDTVFVSVQDPSVKKYYIIKPSDFILNPKGKKLNGFPQLVEVQGEIELQDVVNEPKSIYRALITKAQSAITLNSFLIKGDLPTFDSSDSAIKPSALHGQIVGGQYEGKRILMSNFSLVFLNVGATDGAEVGQTAEVFSNILARNKVTLEIQNHKRIALLKLVHVDSHYSTAYVLENNEEIVFGDLVGAANDQPLSIDEISPIGKGETKPSVESASSQEETDPVVDADIQL